VTPLEILRAVAADLKAQGIPVAFVPGWETRGRPWSFNPRGLLWHHTATKSYANDYPSLGIVRDGRSDLPGPLSQFGLGRHTGTVYFIAAGYANHAGGGAWRGLSGNGSVWGVEAENDGIGEAWGPELVRSYVALSVALARHTGFGPEMICRHAEWSDGGKIDTATAPLNSGSWIRNQVAAAMSGPTPSKEDQLFSTSPIHTVHIIASHSGLLLTSDDDKHGAGVTQQRANGSLNQRWEVWGHDDATVSLVNRAGGFALDRPDYSTEAGTLLQVARTEHNAAQRWSLDQFRSAMFRIWTPGTNRCVDVRMRSMDPGAGAQLWVGLADKDDPRHQQFMFAPTV
jgi:hypothetical protein